MAGVELVPVRRRAEMRDFINLPWRIYEGDENWVPPIKSDVRKLLSPGKHPFWKFSERELFLARRGREVVGRIAAIIDGNYNRYHGENMGAWGFLECSDDPEVCTALFTAAEDWIRDKGMAFLRGPLNPSTNYEVGLLLQGFDSPPSLMMPYNPPYYPELIHFCGFRKEKDLFGYCIPRDYEPPPWAVALARRIVEKNGILIRPLEEKGLKEQLRTLNRIYNECWAKNWGFVPMSEEEVDQTSKELVHILDPKFAFFLYYREEPVGVFVSLPDINPFLKRLNGRLGPTALIKKWLYWSEIRGLRILIFGIKEEYRQMGVSMAVVDYLRRMLKGQEKYRYIEASWTLEDNDAVNIPFEEGGIKPYKRYRIYRKDL